MQSVFNSQPEWWIRDLTTRQETQIASNFGIAFGHFFSPETNRADQQIITDDVNGLCTMNLDGTNRVCMGIPTFNLQSGFWTASTNKTLFDYDGDGKSDVSVFRPSSGAWYLLQSTNGFGSIQFGASGDRPAPADFDGDGRSDVAVYRGNTWFIQRSSLGFQSVQFGTVGDLPTPSAFVP